MTLYSLVLFAHVVSVLALFACLSMETLSLFHLGRASTLSEIRPWIEPVPGLSAIALGSLLVILGSGIYLTIRMSGFSLAWIDVAMGALFVMAPLGAGTGRRMRHIRSLSASSQANQPRVLKLLLQPYLKISLATRIAVFLGIVLLMTAKPDLTASLAVVGVSLVLSWIAAFLIPRRGRPSSPADSNACD